MATRARFAAPTEILHGPDTSEQLGQEVRRLGGCRVAVVTDAGVHGAGVLARAVQSLEAADLPYTVYAEVPADPSFADVDRLAEHLAEFQADTVVSAGGGSVLAAGRTSALTATNGGKTAAIAGSEKYTSRPLLSIGIPTTAGSGGEVSRHATLTDDRTGKKSGVAGWYNAARLAILDPTILVAVPRGQAVSSGIDALTHALEAYVARRATPLTDAIALSAFETIFHELPGSIENRDVDVLDRLHLAATTANIACGNAGLGLVHGLNKGITYVFHTRHYPEVPYGLLHAILLPWVMEFNIPAAPERFAHLAAVMGVDTTGRSSEAAARAGVERMKQWLLQLGAPTRLPWENCPDEAIADIRDETLGRVQATDNPRPSTAEDLREIVLHSVEGWERRAA